MDDIYIGFDFGLKRIGVAVGQLITKSATPIETIGAKNGEPNLEKLDVLINKWKPKSLIVGLPLHMDGTEHEVTYAAKKFVSLLNKRYQLQTYLVDERLTTKAAREMVYYSGGYKALQDVEIDGIAAKLILEDWLKSH